MRTHIAPGELAAIDDALTYWPESFEPPDGMSTPAQRLCSAIRGAMSVESQVGGADLACLLRHVLRAASAIGDPAVIEVPTRSPWPDTQILGRHGLVGTAERDQRRTLHAEKWVPSWLGLDDRNDDPAEAVFQGEQARPQDLLPADPFFTARTGYEHYLSPGQKEAVRTLMFSPPGSSIVAALPTGSGKSVVAYLPALSRSQGLVVVVVPTVALAIDQERAFREIVTRLGKGSDYPTELAYYAEMADGSRSELRKRISLGTQRIVFTSPESVVGTLTASLFNAARKRWDWTLCHRRSAHCGGVGSVVPT